MRFGVAPSRSPSPAGRRRQHRGRSTYGLSLYDSSDEDEEHEVPDDTSLSSDSLFYNSESEAPPRTTASPKTPNKRRSLQDQRDIDETLLSFRRRGEYQDPFKDWSKQIRAAAFRTATKRYEANPASTAATRRRASQLRDLRVQESHRRQCAEVTAVLAQMALCRAQEDAQLVAAYKVREETMWRRVERVIHDEEDKLRRRREAEARARQEELERARREEERRKAEEERKRNEEREKALKEALARMEKEKAAEEAKKRAEEEAQKKADMAKLDQGRKDAGFTTAQEDWETARRDLKLLKEDYLPTIKADSNLRSIWSKTRRAIVPKIGQLTNSPSEIQRITTAILQVILVQPPHPKPLYFSLLSALAKAILMQAETEVSARAVTAYPLAQVTLGLLTQLDAFADVLYARMVQRTGGWAVPVAVGKPAEMDEAAYRKLRGYRTAREEQREFEMRVGGVMRLYFAVLTAEVAQPSPPLWALPRCWTYVARLMSTPVLLRSDMATQVISALLEIGGARAKRAWGKQFVKVLGLLYKSIQETPDGPSSDALDVQVHRRQVGGEGSEGKSGRVKVLLEIEKVMAG